MKTMAGAWEDFAAKALPPQCSDVQQQEMRRAFYGGAFSMLMDVLELGADDSITDDAAAEQLEAKRNEIDLFFTRLGREPGY